MKKHLHKFRRDYLDEKKKHPVLICMVDGCSFMASRRLLMGKPCQCWNCGKKILVNGTTAHPRFATVRCGCTTTKVKQAKEATKEILKANSSVLDDLIDSIPEPKIVNANPFIK